MASSDLAAAMQHPAFLLCHGSFNPVHRHHVEIMVRARLKLEVAGYHVVAGVLAPCHRAHLRWKGVEALTDEHRFAALRLACAAAAGPAGWLRCDTRGIDYGSAHAMVRRLLKPEFQREHPQVVGFDVMGADVVAKYCCYKHALWYPCVIVGRAGSTDEVLRGLEEAGGRAEAEGRTLFLLEEELPGALSSTRLREALCDGDASSVSDLCSTGAAEYLLAQKIGLYAPHDEPSEEEWLEEGRWDWETWKWETEDWDGQGETLVASVAWGADGGTGEGWARADWDGAGAWEGTAADAPSEPNAGVPAGGGAQAMAA